MALNLTQAQINELWEKGYRPYEIYTKNPAPVVYYGEQKQAGEIGGWDITFVFARRETLETFPFFDCVIGQDAVSSCTAIHHA